MRRHTYACLGVMVSLWFGALAPRAAAKDDPAKTFRAGVSRVDVTPPVFPVSMVGSFTDRKATAAHDPLAVRCLVLDDGALRVAIAVVDVCILPRELCLAAKRAAAKASGILPEHILLSSTHTHSAPPTTVLNDIPVDPAYVELLTRKIAQAVADACRQLVPVKLGWGVTPVPGQVFNRRWFMKEGAIAANPFGHVDRVQMNPGVGNPNLDKPAGPTDPNVSVLSLQALDGRPVALLGNYSVHYVGDVPPAQLSADYFGEFCRQVESRLGGANKSPRPLALLTNGASGDVNNIDFRNPRKRGEAFSQIRRVAGEIADAALTIAGRADHRPHVSLAMCETELDLAVRKPDVAGLKRARQILAQPDDKGLPRLARYYADQAVRLSKYPDKVRVTIQALRVGELGIVAIPCEVFAEIGLEIKRRSPFTPTFVIALANGYNGYLPTPDQHALGGYETWAATSSYLEPRASCKIADAAIDLLRKTQTAAVRFPGSGPGAARAQAEAGSLTLENDVLLCKWSTAGGKLKPARIIDKLSGASLGLADAECFRFSIARSPSPQPQLIKASDLVLIKAPQVSTQTGEPTAARLAERYGGRRIEATLATPDGLLEVQWQAILGDGANYIRQQVTLCAKRAPLEINDLTLVECAAPHADVVGQVDGSPVVAGNFFLGYEHPMSRMQTATAQGSLTSVRGVYPYHIAIDTARPLMHSSVVGVVPAGQLRRGFLHYLERERAQPYHTFLHHNCGYQVGARHWQLKRFAPEEFEKFLDHQEELWVGVIDQFGLELVEMRGAVLDSFVLDDGWDDVYLVWQFHRGYAQGLAPERIAAGKFGSAPGIWFSPAGGYSGRKSRVEAGMLQGFECNRLGLSLAGPRYFERFREACLGMVRNYGVNYFKFDGFGAGNSLPGAGPYAGDVEGLLQVCRQLRRHNSEVFLNPTTGAWPSPFWLLSSDAIWRQESDAGFLGPGSDRQQWLTYRDNATYHATALRGPLYPLSSLMLHGIMIHEFAFKDPYNPKAKPVSREPADLKAEIRSYFATGANLQELHVNPSLMTDQMWDVLAEAARWSRANADVLADTHWIGGDPAQGAVYGWASWSPRKAILALRNPSDKPAQIAIDVAQAFELPVDAPRAYLLRSPWQEDAARPALTLRAGAPHTFTLAPFEVLVCDAAVVRQWQSSPRRIVVYKSCYSPLRRPSFRCLHRPRRPIHSQPNVANFVAVRPVADLSGSWEVALATLSSATSDRFSIHCGTRYCRFVGPSSGIAPGLAGVWSGRGA